MAERKPTESKKDKDDWEVTANRFVAYFDILGFKNRVMRESHEKVYEQLEKISRLKLIIENHKYTLEDKQVYITIFSDSIFVFSEDASGNSFDFFIAAITTLFGATISNKIPLKGAIAYGEITVDKENQIYFGQPIIDVYLLEQDVNYMGIVAHHSIDKYIEEDKRIDLKQYFFKSLLLEIKTPLKSGRIAHTNISWFHKVFFDGEEKTEEEVNTILEERIKTFRTSSTGAARRYVDNTLEVFNRYLDYEEENKKLNKNT